MMRILEFCEALKDAEQYSKRHLLLGNGFSIACKHDIFSYNALFDRAEFKTVSDFTRAAFDILGTRDFEEVMHAFRNAALLLAGRDGSLKSYSSEFMRCIQELREVLVGTIANQHPDKPSDISVDSYRACRTFLTDFDHIYSLNYDLLLYWALMQMELKPDVPFDDGFRKPSSGPEEYVTWEVENTNTQNLYYLHGALHLFDAGAELQKYTWVNTQIRLVDQVRKALSIGLFPVIVAEDSSPRKKEKIVHSNYLSRGYRSLPQIKGALFIYGHSLAGNDEHILHLIEISKLSHIYISLFGDPASMVNQHMIGRGTQLGKGRILKKVTFYSASSANVWG